MKILKNENWGLKLLALILASVIDHALKDENVRIDTRNDQPFFR